MTECTFLGILPQDVGLRSNEGVGRSDIKLLANVRAARHQQQSAMNHPGGVDELMPKIFPKKYDCACETCPMAHLNERVVLTA